MKFVGAQLSYYLKDKAVRRNSKVLLKYIVLLFSVIVIYSVLFQLIMVYVEGENHSWITGFYWTLTVMSTLGFGDITFHSDIGRIFSMIVLLSGIFLLLIVLPFVFIRYFYAPFLDSRTRSAAPRKVPEGTKDHIVIINNDTIAEGLIRRMKSEGIPYFIIEPDATIAADMHFDGLPVIAGQDDNEKTYEALNIKLARMVIVNREDTVNTKIILTIRHIAPKVPIISLADEDDSVDVLELSGASRVLPLKSWLGEQLSNRVTAQHAEAHSIGRYEDLHIAELPVHHTPLAGKTVRTSQLKEKTGVNIIGIWERGRMRPARKNIKFTPHCVLVIIGTAAQFKKLNQWVLPYDKNPNPVLIIGGGKVGAAAARALMKRNIPVNLIERSAAQCRRMQNVCTNVFKGDAADYELVKKAGIREAPSVVLTTNDDAMNVFLASYCRKLNSEVRIISRITEERNIDVIHRAGADFVLSYASLGAEAIFSILKGKKLTILGEGINLFNVPTPKSLFESTLTESAIGAKSGLTVIGIQLNGEVNTSIHASTIIPPESELLLLGGEEQLIKFKEIYK